MSRVDAAAADRLPWLPDEPQQRPAKRRGGAVLGWAAAAIVAVAGAGFWMGVRSVDEQPLPPSGPAASTTTVRLPQLPSGEPIVRAPAQPQVKPVPAPEVRPAPRPELRIVLPRAERAAKASSQSVEVPAEAQTAVETETPKPAAATASPQAEFVPPKPWDPRIFAGASGRLVQIGAFGSTRQAKRGWWFMVKAYPAVAHLPAVVRVSRNSKGRAFYRFHVGTTSQAHSEVLCQRMQLIRLSCAVVGLPWKTKVER
jgi:hypothetical protein